MKFFPTETKYLYEGQPGLSGNELYFKSQPYGSEDVIQFGGWWQELDVDAERNALVCFGAIFSEKKVKKVPLRLPEWIDAKISVDNTTEKQKSLPVFYDEQSGWFCFGERNFRGSGYRFATDTVAVIFENKLEAIFVHPEIKSV